MKEKQLALKPIHKQTRLPQKIKIPPFRQQRELSDCPDAEYVSSFLIQMVPDTMRQTAVV